MIQSIEQQLKNIADKRLKDVDEIVRASLVRITNKIIQESPVRDGRFKNNWMSAFGSVDMSTGRPDDASGAGSTGAVKIALDEFKLDGAAFFFTNSLPYAARLEYEGWSDQAPNGVVRVNLLTWEAVVNDEIRKRQ